MATRQIEGRLNLKLDRNSLNKEMSKIRRELTNATKGGIINERRFREQMTQLKRQVTQVNSQIIRAKQKLENSNLKDFQRKRLQAFIKRGELTKNELSNELRAAQVLGNFKLQNQRELNRLRTKAAQIEANNSRRLERQRMKAAEREMARRQSMMRGLTGTFGFSGALAAGLGVRRTIADNTSLEKSLFVLETALGDATEARIAFETVKSTAKEFGADLNSSVFAFSQFAASVKDTSLAGQESVEIFRAVTKQAAVTGASIQDFQGVFRAIRQIATKGKVQAEELVGQLGERIPGAINLMAEGLGVTRQELFKLLETGKLASEDALPALKNAINESVSDERARQNVNTLNGLFNLMNTAIFELSTELGTGGANELIKELAKGVIGVTEALKPAAKVLGILLKVVSALISPINMLLTGFNTLLEKTKDTSLDAALSVGALTLALGGLLKMMMKIKVAVLGNAAGGLLGSVGSMLPGAGKIGKGVAKVGKFGLGRLALGASGVGLVVAAADAMIQAFTGFSFFDKMLDMVGSMLGLQKKEAQDKASKKDDSQAGKIVQLLHRREMAIKKAEVTKGELSTALAAAGMPALGTLMSSNSTRGASMTSKLISESRLPLDRARMLNKVVVDNSLVVNVKDTSELDRVTRTSRENQANSIDLFNFTDIGSF